MKPFLLISYLVIIYGALAWLAPAADVHLSSFCSEATPDFVTDPVLKSTAVPEPGSIGLVSLLVVMLAAQRRR